MSEERDAIDESLRRAFAVPDLSAVQLRVEAATRPAPPRRWIAVAAIAAAAVAVAALASRREDRVDETIAVHDEDLAARRRAGDQLAALHTATPTLPRPDEAGCLEPTPPDACRGDFPVLAASDDLELLGECGAPGGEPCASFDVPLTRVVQLRDRVGTELLVYIDRRTADPRPLLAADSALRIFRRELGAFVLYEVTPLDAAQAIDHFAL